MTTGRRRGGMVRSFTPTEGEAEATRRSLDETTLLFADEKVPRHRLGVEERRVMELCLPGVLSVVEVSAHLRLPCTVTKVVVSALVDSGHLLARAPVPAARHHDPKLLEKILDGLHAL